MSGSILPNYPKMTIALVEGHTSPIRLTLVSGVTTACCPGCGTPSARICSTYRRKLQEIPYGSAAVELQLIVHRFRCDVPACTQHIFCERVPWAPRGKKALAAWCRIAEASNIPEVIAFVATLGQDRDAVAAGVTQPWSQGPVEGFNTRTKLLKRMMYGRAKLLLLRARILHR